MLVHPTLTRLSLSLAQKLNAAIDTVETEQTTLIQENRGKHLARELDLFEATGQRPTNATLLYEALKSIPPTSVESERVFSAAGLFVTKLRTRLNDSSLDHLSFLKSYNNNKQRSE